MFQLFGRTVKCNIAKDNGRAKDYIRRKVYPDKSKCYECGVSTQLFGRTVKCNIAKDNGRAKDCIRRKVYPDKSKCYECGVSTHTVKILKIRTAEKFAVIILKCEQSGFFTIEYYIQKMQMEWQSV